MALFTKDRPETTLTAETRGSYDELNSLIGARDARRARANRDHVRQNQS